MAGKVILFKITIKVISELIIMSKFLRPAKIFFNSTLIFLRQMRTEMVNLTEEIFI